MNQRIVKTLEGLARSNDGVLLPEQVVDAARPRNSVLHSQFCWDNTEAADKYRLYQARQLIRTVVRVISINGKQRPMRVFVSLTPDREDGGYREIGVVLSSKTMREQMLEDAFDELKVFEVKYAHLKELSGVFKASQSARKKLGM